MPAALAGRDLALSNRENAVRGIIQRDPAMWAQAHIVLTEEAEAAKGMTASECEGSITTFSAAEVRKYAAGLDTRERELLGAERAVNSFNSRAG